MGEESININDNNEENIPVVQRLCPCDLIGGKEARGFTFPDHEYDFQISPPPKALLSSEECYNKMADKK